MVACTEFRSCTLPQVPFVASCRMVQQCAARIFQSSIKTSATISLHKHHVLCCWFFVIYNMILYIYTLIWFNMYSNYIPLWYPLISIVFSIVSSINITPPGPPAKSRTKADSLWSSGHQSSQVGKPYLDPCISVPCIMMISWCKYVSLNHCVLYI